MTRWPQLIVISLILEVLGTEVDEEWYIYPRTNISCFCSGAQSWILFLTPWTAAGQISLSFNISWSLLKLMSIESVMPSNHLVLCRPLLLLPSIFPSIRVFSSQLFTSGGQSIGASASASVLPMNIQDCFPLGLTGLISFLSKGDTNTTVQKHQFFSSQPFYGPTLTFIHDYWKTIALTIRTFVRSNVSAF